MRHSKSIVFRVFILVLILVFPYSSQGAVNPDSTGLNPDSSVIHKGRLTGVLIVQGSLYIASLTGLYFAWYSNYPQSSFHFFNDDNEWQQMDKCGHAMTSYYISRIGYESYKWSGVERKKAIWFGSLLGLAYMTNIEILDGFSSQWGFSIGDMTANTIGCVIFAGQQFAWDDQRFLLKFSYHQTTYPLYRPDLLGSNLIQQMIKDYNGQTYWLSGNVASFLHKDAKFPKWINIAAGYGAGGMTGASANSLERSGRPIPADPRYRKFFLSMDVDLTKIPTKSKALKVIFAVFSFIKIPFPALEYNTLGQFKFHYLYY
jgi:hypothetical protein